MTLEFFLGYHDFVYFVIKIQPYFSIIFPGVFRTISGNPESVLDIIPADYVVNSSLAMGWYLGTHTVSEPEVIHTTSGLSLFNHILTIFPKLNNIFFQKQDRSTH